MFRRVLSASLLLLASACASIVSDHKTSLDTSPVSASCKLVGNAYDVTITTPTVMELPKRAAPITATCEAPGYEKAVQVLDTEFNAAVLGNVLIGGVVGVVVDAANDNDRKYPSEFLIDMQKDIAGVTLRATPSAVQQREAVGMQVGTVPNQTGRLAEVNKKWSDVETLIRQSCEPSKCAQELAAVAELRDIELAALARDQAKNSPVTPDGSTRLPNKPEIVHLETSRNGNLGPLLAKFEPVEYSPPTVRTVVKYTNKVLEVDDVDRFTVDMKLDRHDFVRVYGGFLELGDNLLSINSNFEVDTAGTSMTSTIDSAAKSAIQGFWPLAPGKGINFEVSEVSHGGAVSNGVYEEWKYRVRVLGQQKVRLEKMELDTILILTNARSEAGRVFEQMQWFSPELRFVVKSERRWSGRLVDHAKSGMKAGDREESELIELQNTTTATGAQSAKK